ncbi:unnamed protein product [Ascophyllum nodosum]
MRELGRKCQDPQQDGLKQPTGTEEQEKERMRRLEERTVRFWRRDVTGKRRETGVLYSGESKRAGDAWVPHGHGEYRVNTEIIYEGAFCNGAMHGDGRLLLDNGETWVGKLRKDMMHGIGTLISKDDTQQRRAIYWRGRRVCFLDGEAHSSNTSTDDAPRTARVAPACSPCIQELKPGCRLKLMSDEYTQVANGEGMVVSDNEDEGRYLVRLDSGVKKLLRLDCEHFRVLRHKPPVIPLDPIVEATAGKVLYDYDEDQANPKTTVYRENFFWPNLWAGQAKEKEEEQAELDLQAKRSKVSEHDSLWQPPVTYSNKCPRPQKSSRAQHRLNSNSRLSRGHGCTRFWREGWPSKTRRKPSTIPRIWAGHPTTKLRGKSGSRERTAQPFQRSKEALKSARFVDETRGAEISAGPCLKTGDCSKGKSKLFCIPPPGRFVNVGCW